MPNPRAKPSRPPSKLRISWTFDTSRGEEFRGPGLLAPRTLAHAIERGLARNQLNLFSSALRKGEQFVGGAGQLAHSNDIAAEFALRLSTSPTRRMLTFRIVVARNDHDRGDILKREVKNLQWLSERIGKQTFSIERTGAVFSPDRHGRATHHRRLPAYVTPPSPELSVATFGNREQLAIVERTPKLLTRDDTDHIRRRIVELCLRAHDAASGRALPPPELDRGALRLKRSGRGRPEPFIAGCPTLWNYIDATTLLHRIVGFEWRRGNDILPLLPGSPVLLREACFNALGRETGRELLRSYASALEGKRFPEHRRLAQAVVRELVA